MATRILYIAEEAQQRRELVGRMRSQGYEVVEAGSSKEAMAALDRAEFDVVISDLTLPDRSGLELLHDIKKHPSAPAVILQSSHASIDTARSAIAAGADQFLSKPVSPQNLELAVTQSLERVQLLRRLQESERDLRLTMENVLDMVYIVDTDGRFTMVSPAVEDLLGYKPDELIGRSAFDLIPPERRDEMQQKFQGAISLSTGTVRSQILPLVARSGETRQFEVSTHIIYDGNRPVAEYGIARDVTRRLRMEAELSRRNEELQRSFSIVQAILDTTQSAIIMVDPDDRISVFNRAASEFFGMTPVRLQNRTFEKIVTDLATQFEDAAAFLRQLESLRNDPDDPHDYLTDLEVLPRRLKLLQPEERFLSVLSFVVREKNDRVMGRLWIFTDTTRAQRSDELLRMLVQAVPIASIIARASDGEILYANDSLSRLMRLPADELIGRKTPQFYVNPEDRARVMDSLIELGYCKDMDVQLRRADGSVFWAVLTLVRGELSGEAVSIGVVYDIDERKEAEQALRRERNFVSAVLDTIGALVVVLDRQGHIVRFNRTCERLTGYDHREVINKPFDDLFLLDEEKGRVNSLLDRLFGGDYPLYGENYWLTRDGERRLIAWSNTVLTDDDGVVNYIVATGIDITDQREAEEKLRLYRRIYENAHDGITIFSPEGRLIESNPAMQQTSGYTLDDLHCMSIKELVGPDFYDRAEASLLSRGRFRGEIDITTARGDRKAVEVSLFTIKGDNDEVAYISGIGRDISERKEAEQRVERRLRYEEALAECSRVLLETPYMDEAINSLLSIIRVTAQVDRTYLFENFIDDQDRMCCRQRYEVVGKDATAEIDNPELQHICYAEHLPRWQQQLASGNEIFGRTEDFPKSERTLLEPQDIVAILIIPIRVGGDWWGFVGLDDCTGDRRIDDEDRRVLRTAAEMIGVYIERRQSQEALRESEQRFRSLVENAREIIYSVNPSGVFTYVSPNWKQILGHEVGDVLGRGIDRFVIDEDLPRCREFMEQVLAHGDSGEIEYRVRHKDGSVRWHHTSASPLRDESGKIVAGIGVAHDVTDMHAMVSSLERANRELRDAQSQLVQSEKMASLGLLVAGIAHEINTPIGAVGSMHNTLMRSIEKLRAILEESAPELLQDNTQSQRLLKVIDDANAVIKNGTGRVTTIVRRLRSFARLDEAELKTCDIHEGIEDTLTLIYHEIKHGIEIVRDFGDIPQIACYPGKLNQVFLNILNNARQAMGGKGILTIRTRVRDGYLSIEFSDTGSGIKPEHLDKVFDPGFTTKGVGIGTGLGLSICYQIIRDHHGRIEVDSEVGKGTTFRLLLPISQDKTLGRTSTEPDGA